MSKYELLKFQDAEALAEEAARQFIRWAASRTNVSKSVAVSGGRIAGTFFSSVVRFAGSDGANLRNLHFFWADERCVPPQDPESNFRMANERMLLPLQIPADHVHRIPGELGGGAAAAQAEIELRKLCPEEPPVLDLVLLGMGEDGHVASLFPGEPESAQRDPAVYRAVIGPKPPPSRVTLGYRPLAVAREVWVLVSGAGKRDALCRSVAEPASTPVGHVVTSRARTRIFTDQF